MNRVERDELAARLRPGMANSIPKDCGNSGYQRKIHDPTVWRYLQQMYIETNENAHAQTYAEKWETYPSYSGFTVTVDIRDDGHRGRSVYAAEPIKKGTLVWDPFHLAQFHTPQEMRDFLQELDYDLQCDALLWAYVEKNTNYVALALDPASFVNHGESEDVVNLDENCYALRDIEIGEELLENYSHFIGFDNNQQVEWFHRIRGVAWKEEGHSTRSHSAEEYNLIGAPKTRGTLSPAVSAFAISCLMAACVVRKFIPLHFSKKQKGGL